LHVDIIAVLNEGAYQYVPYHRKKTIISFGGIMIWIYLKLHLLIQIMYGKLLVSRGTAPFFKNANPPDYYIEKNHRKSKPN